MCLFVRVWNLVTDSNGKRRLKVFQNKVPRNNTWT